MKEIIINFYNKIILNEYTLIGFTFITFSISIIISIILVILLNNFIDKIKNK